MYNRYIPQPDGTYRRSSIQEVSRSREETPKAHTSAPVSAPQQVREHTDPPVRPCTHIRTPRGISTPGKQQEVSSGSIGSFLKQLLPRDFDTADLIVVLLLLLIATDGCEDGNTALLTLVLYLFL